MSTTTYRNVDGSEVTIVIPDPVVTPAVVTVGDASYTWTPAPPVPAVSVPVGTLFGNTPRGSDTVAALAATDAVYGTAGAVVRWYFTGAPNAAALPTDRAVVVSYKTAPAMRLNTMREFLDHEIDHQVIANGVSLPDWGAKMKRLGLTDFCLTDDAFTNPAKNPETYLAAAGPQIAHVGVDFDGLSPKKPGDSYHDYTAGLAAVVAFCKKHGLTWGVPEFGADQAPDDTDGTRRAAWLLAGAKMFRDAGAEYVCVWEDPIRQPGSTFRTPAEVATVRAMLALGPRAGQ